MEVYLLSLGELNTLADGYGAVLEGALSYVAVDARLFRIRRFKLAGARSALFIEADVGSLILRSVMLIHTAE